MLIDPIELYRYPYEWYKNRSDAIEKVKSGLYILTKDGYLKRGITTATTVCAAINAAISSLYKDVDEIEVLTPVGLKVKVKVEATNGVAIARKFAGDHEFDVTDGMEVIAKLTDERGVKFGAGIGVINGKKAVSQSAFRQIMENFRLYARMYNYKGGVIVEVPEGEKIAKKTKNEKLGIVGGISILGTTGFVEPWCKKLVETKIEIAKQYDKIVICTGRKSWLYAFEKYKDYQPFVFGVHIDEILASHPGEKILIGSKGLLARWAGGEDKIEIKAKRYNVKKVEIID